MLASITASTTTSPAGDHVSPAVASEPSTLVRLPIGAGAGRAQTTAELRQAKPDRLTFQARTRLPVRVILDGVRQGYNVGALFRLCDAFPPPRLRSCFRPGQELPGAYPVDCRLRSRRATRPTRKGVDRRGCAIASYHVRSRGIGRRPGRTGEVSARVPRQLLVRTD